MRNIKKPEDVNFSYRLKFSLDIFFCNLVRFFVCDSGHDVQRSMLSDKKPFLNIDLNKRLLKVDSLDIFNRFGVMHDIHMKILTLLSYLRT